MKLSFWGRPGKSGAAIAALVLAAGTLSAAANADAPKEAAVPESTCRPDGELSPDRIDFVTATLKSPAYKWVRVEGLERAAQHGEVHARLTGPESIVVTTKNVTALKLSPRTGGEAPAIHVLIDGQRVLFMKGRNGPPYSLIKEKGRWHEGQLKTAQKPADREPEAR